MAGAAYVPSKFTQTDVSSAHGSDANAGCPSDCVRMVSGVRVCDCVGVTIDRTGITLIDGVIPMLDVSQPNRAAQLYTATPTRNSWWIDVLFPNSFVLRRVDLYLFICPTQNIPNRGVLSISIYQSLLFPCWIKGLLLGNVSLSMEGPNCAELIQTSIPTKSTFIHSIYLIDISMENVLGGIYIGEIVFSDEVALTTSSKFPSIETSLIYS